MDLSRFEQLCRFSVALHGHKYVFPVAVWLLEEGSTTAVTQPEVRRSLVHADSVRIYEALERLVEIGAVVEHPKVAGRRYFQRREAPYWEYVDAQLRTLQGVHLDKRA